MLGFPCSGRIAGITRNPPQSYRRRPDSMVGIGSLAEKCCRLSGIMGAERVRHRHPWRRMRPLRCDSAEVLLGGFVQVHRCFRQDLVAVEHGRNQADTLADFAEDNGGNMHNDGSTENEKYQFVKCDVGLAEAAHGIPGRGIYDNMKTAVDRVGRGKQRDVNARFLTMTSHYVFEPEFCNPAAGWEKGQVEKNVRDARHRLWQVAPVFPDLKALNNWLEDRCTVLWAETAHGSLPGSIADAWETEKAALMPLPTAFDGFVELSKRVSPTCLITFDRNRYSVPASFANRRVSLHIYPEKLVVVTEGQVICTHERIIERSHRQPGRVIYDWRHYLAVVQRKPGALRNGAPFLEMPDPFRQLQDQLLRKPAGDREMVDILSLVLHHEEQAVLCAVEMALEAGVPTKTHVLNLLHRLVDGTPTDQPDVTPPSALALSKEPEANVSRYDGLRQGGTRHAS